uniref:RNA-directed DNA polymerase, eukaryota, reverse transcriptase zinc-binding domain protein n=1 Tax=Tanacetum cinerariifolium TaxID=118510 RepID=A0A6L2NWN8_TANCI|nr:RNA-directed DNA polymerase, eukaryota, reverse transcriptase zinc-binding domain protein [Tanacetum cinerariifolium]
MEMAFSSREECSVRMVINDFYGIDGGFGSPRNSFGMGGIWCDINRLPTRSNLSHRGVILSSSCCPLCESAIEDIDHCLIRFPMLNQIWRKEELKNMAIFQVPEEIARIKDEDIFPSIQRLAKVWIECRSKSHEANWSCWIARPFEILKIMPLSWRLFSLMKSKLFQKNKYPGHSSQYPAHLSQNPTPFYPAYVNPMTYFPQASYAPPMNQDHYNQMTYVQYQQQQQFNQMNLGTFSQPPQQRLRDTPQNLPPHSSTQASQSESSPVEKRKRREAKEENPDQRKPTSHIRWTQ